MKTTFRKIRAFTHEMQVIALVVLCGIAWGPFAYSLGTANTGQRAVNSATTIAPTNQADPFDDLAVINNYGSDLWVPTKTLTEWKSMWDNEPANVEIHTDKEDFVDLTINSTNRKYYQVTEAHCDNGGYLDNNYTWSYYGEAYNIIEIDAPTAITGYLWARMEFDGSAQPDEDTRTYYQIPGQATVPLSHFQDLYDDGGSTTQNDPDLDYNNAGGNDLATQTVDDPDGAAWGWYDVKLTPTAIQLKSGTNYFRVEGKDYKCKQNDTSASSAYPPGDQARIWFSNK